MARGWESKSIEDQQAQASQDSKKKKVRLTPDQAARQRQIDGLELARTRISEQLRAATNERHRAMLEAALADLDHQLLDLRNT
jgi:hypothetical protein